MHPGYGFLAENADFAQAVHRCGSDVWSARRRSAIRQMGDKARRSASAREARVPTIPGYRRWKIRAATAAGGRRPSASTFR